MNINKIQQQFNINANYCVSVRYSYACSKITELLFSVRDIKYLPDTIFLVDDIVTLSEVVVKPQTIKHKTAGRKGSSGFIAMDVEGYKAAGQGLAIPLKVKKQLG